MQLIAVLPFCLEDQVTSMGPQLVNVRLLNCDYLIDPRVRMCLPTVLLCTVRLHAQRLPRH